MSSRNKNKSFKKLSVNDEYQWTPLLITIGPTGCGKTSFLKNLGPVADFAIDDIPQVNEIIELDALEALLLNRITPTNLSLRTYNISIGDRIKSLILGNSEDMLISKYIFKLISEVDFESAISVSVGDKDLSKDLIDAVKKVVKKNNFIFTTKTYSLFIPESISFATSESLYKLKENVKNKPVNVEKLVSWGNANSQIRDFDDVLVAAQISKRPVRFIRWGLEIPRVSFSELIEINIERFMKTGKYASVSHIKKSLLSVEEMLGKIKKEEILHHSAIAKLAGYAMDCNGHIMKGENRYETSSVNPTKYAAWQDDTIIRVTDFKVILPLQVNIETLVKPMRKESNTQYDNVTEVDDVIKIKDHSHPTFVPKNESSGFYAKKGFEEPDLTRKNGGDNKNNTKSLVAPMKIVSNKEGDNVSDADVITIKDHSHPTFIPKNESSGFSFSESPESIHRNEINIEEQINFNTSSHANTTKAENSNSSPFSCFTTAIFCTFNNK